MTLKQVSRCFRALLHLSHLFPNNVTTPSYQSAFTRAMKCNVDFMLSAQPSHNVIRDRAAIQHLMGFFADSQTVANRRCLDAIVSTLLKS